MAKKCEWDGKPAYEEGPMILMLDEELNKWIVIHRQTRWAMMGPNVSFKQKREALAYVNNLIESFDLDFDSKEKMQEINGGRDNCVRLRNLAYQKAMAPK